MINKELYLNPKIQLSLAYFKEKNINIENNLEKSFHEFNIDEIDLIGLIITLEETHNISINDNEFLNFNNFLSLLEYINSL
jgi:acyl carrier protein